MRFSRLLIIKSLITNQYLRNTTRMSYSLDPDHARRLVGPALGPNCLRRVSANDTSWQLFRYGFTSLSELENERSCYFFIIYELFTQNSYPTIIERRHLTSEKVTCQQH